MNSKQLKRILTRPADFVRFQATGQVPKLTRPRGPLVDLLKSIPPRDLQCIRGVRVDRDLGYQGSRMFATAWMAFKWCAPSDEMFESESWAAESWRIKGFTKPLKLEDLLAKSASFPERLRNGRIGN